MYNIMLHREVRDRVNPITGVIDEPRVNPLEVNIHKFPTRQTSRHTFASTDTDVYCVPTKVELSN